MNISGSVRKVVATPARPAAPDPVGAWLDSARRSCDMRVRAIALSQSREWLLERGALHHRKGAFFTVVGATVHVDGVRQAPLDQPLIDQAEVGILGFLIRRSGERGAEILVQAKPEPGNVGLVQAAPSVQATESNYRRRHGGRGTPFLDCFRSPRAGAVHLDVLQSEQGTRFLGKYNRNMVVEAPPHLDIHGGPACRWFPMDELLPLLEQDHAVNTDARSVMASAPWSLLAPGGRPFARWRDGGPGEALLRSFEAPEERCALSMTAILERLRGLRRAGRFVTEVVDLADLWGWEMAGPGPAPDSPAALALRQFEVTSSDREVSHWDQPLMTAAAGGEAVLLGQERNGIVHFLFEARPEIGFRERLQYGPTIQDAGEDLVRCFGHGRQSAALHDVASRARTLSAIENSDEGGRFFRCTTRYRAALLDREDRIEDDETHAWMTLGQIQRLVRHSGVFTNEARTLISMLLAWL